jgi:DNA-binding NarL/FixJ family response regulator
MKLMIVGEHTLLRDSLYHLIDRLEENPAVLDATDVNQALRLLDSNNDLDLLVLILDLPKHGWDPLAALKRSCPGLPILVLGGSENAKDIQQAIASGAQGFVSTAFTWQGLVHAIRTVLAGDIYVPARFKSFDDSAAAAGSGANVIPIRDYSLNSAQTVDGYRLTPRQRDVLRLIRQGKSNKEIARSLRMAEGTVKIHCMAIFRELGVTNRTQAALLADNCCAGGPTLQQGQV